MKTLRRFLALAVIVAAAFVWSGCNEDEDPTIAGLPLDGGAWMPLSSLLITNGTSGVVNTGLR